jgi:ASC-1-like (ASCH) protein
MGMDIPWVLEIKEPYFSMTDRGEKTLEGGAPDTSSKGDQNERGKNYRHVCLFDPVRIQLVDEHYKRVLSKPQLHFSAWNVNSYDSIEDALKIVDFKKLIPDAKSAEDVMLAYHGRPGYKELIRKNGFVVIELNKTFP